MRIKLPFLAVTVLSLIAPVMATAQAPADQSAEGRQFIVAFPDTTMNTYDPRFKDNRFKDHAYIMLYSTVDNICSVRGPGYTRDTIAIQAGHFRIIDLLDPVIPAEAPIATVQGNAVKNLFTVLSDKPVFVYCMLVTRFGTEAWTPEPAEYWGMEYRAAAVPGEVAHNVFPWNRDSLHYANIMAPSEIMVIAATDNTNVTIIPGGLLWLNPPTTVTLNAGEGYIVQSFVDTLSGDQPARQPDLGGTLIRADHPIGVISGNTRAQIIDDGTGLGKNAFKNLLMESLSPVSQYGTRFVYVPTQDSLNGKPSDTNRRQLEFVRIYGTDTSGTKVWYFENGRRIDTAQVIPAGSFTEFPLIPNAARVFETDKPAQAMMHSSAVVQYGGTQGIPGYAGPVYYGWGPYMTTLVPREQWVSFAPYYSISVLSGMTHTITVVTDTLHRNDIYSSSGVPFPVPNLIPGTDLCWGSQGVVPGKDNWLEGRNGARFTGTVQGEYRGLEERRIGSQGVAEYEENIGIAYGYPLAQLHISYSNTGGGVIEGHSYDCSSYTYTVALADTSASSFKSVALDTGGLNATVNFVVPQQVRGARNLTIVVGAIDPTMDASATILIQDSVGLIRRVPFVYHAQKANFSFDTLNLSTLPVGSVKIVSQTISVPAGSPDVKVLSVRVLWDSNGASPFNATAVPLPLVIPAGGTTTIKVIARPTQPNRHYVDTLVVQFECREVRMLLILDTTPASEVSSAADEEYSLAQISPNPVTTSADIHFTLGKSAPTTVDIYNSRGEKVKGLLQEVRPAGEQILRLDCMGYPSGTYFCRVSSGEWSSVQVFVIAQ